MIALSLAGCGVLWGGFGLPDLQQSRDARSVHVAVAGMFEAIVGELTAMLKDGTLTPAQGDAIAPAIKVGRTAIKASNAFLLQAKQQRELGRDDVAVALEENAYEQLRVANGHLDMLRNVHLEAVETAPVTPLKPPPLLAVPPQPQEG